MSETIEAELPDGTVLEFPSGTKQSVVDAAVKKHLFNAGGKPELNILQRRMGLGHKGNTAEKLADAVSGYNVGGKVTDALAGRTSPETAAAVGTGANFLAELVPTFLGGGAAKTAALPASQNLARGLMRSSVKPSVAIPDAKVERAIEGALQRNISPTMSSMKETSSKVGQLDEAIDAILKTSDGRVSNTAVANRLVDELHKAEKQALNAEDLASIRKFWDEFVKTHPDNISVLKAHELKKGTYAQLGQGAYNSAQPTADLANKTKAQKSLARGYKEEVAAAEPAVAPLLKEQSELANILSVFGNRALVEQNKNPIGMGLVTPSLERMALWMLDRSAAAKSVMAQQLYTGAAPASLGRLGGGYYGLLGGQEPQGVLYR